jgi:hypothetical protein
LFFLKKKNQKTFVMEEVRARKSDPGGNSLKPRALVSVTVFGHGPAIRAPGRPAALTQKWRDPMTPSPRLRALALSFGLLAAPLLASPALAQQMGMPEGQAMPQGHKQDPMERVNRQIAQLHQTLKITQAQEPQWEALARVMRENAGNMETLFKERASHFDQMNAVDSLKSYERIAEAHVSNMHHLIPTFEALYQVLSPEQRRAADAAFRYQEARRKARMQGGQMNGQMPNGQMPQMPMSQPGQN